MQKFTTLEQVQAYRQSLQKNAQTLALVPTMGNLHAGHLSLIQQAKQHADTVMVSIFVNPAQFAPNEDFDNYPRTLEHDIEQLKALNIDAVFCPTSSVIYPNGSDELTQIRLGEIGKRLCGLFRPHFFDGVALVVNKLFNIVQPQVAVFGEKDWQQLLCIKKMVSDFNLPIKIVSSQTVREADGLALSSRNQYLSATERDMAPLMHDCLQQAKTKVLAMQATDEIIERQKHRLTQAGFKVDYFAICDAATLRPALATNQTISILCAATLGSARLIDNIYFTR